MNIFEIEQDLLSIFDEIEENEGELTPELEEKLKVTQENFKNKVESYINIIKIKQGEINTISAEIERLNKIAESKNKLANRLNKIIIQAVNKFGDVSKSGAKFFDYGTGKISVKKTQVVDTNDALIEYVGKELEHRLHCRWEENQLNVLGPITKKELIDYLDSELFKITEDDLNNIKLNITTEVNLTDVIENGDFEFLKNAFNLTHKVKLNTKVSKAELKSKLKENGACAPNIAALDYNESLIIK